MNRRRLLQAFAAATFAAVVEITGNLPEKLWKETPKWVSAVRSMFIVARKGESLVIPARNEANLLDVGPSGGVIDYQGDYVGVPFDIIDDATERHMLARAKHKLETKGFYTIGSPTEQFQGLMDWVKITFGRLQKQEFRYERMSFVNIFSEDYEEKIMKAEWLVTKSICPVRAWASEA